MSKGTILLVEDDENLGFVTQDSLQLEGYEVRWAKTGNEGLDYFKNEFFDLCLLDVMLPSMDGFTLAEEIRKRNEFVPILFLTARSMEQDRLRGFEIGGDDYITKPFSLPELMHRIRVFMRRKNVEADQTSQSELIQIGNYSYNPKNLLLVNGDSTNSLTQMEGDLLSILLRNKNNLVTRTDILVAIWGEDDYFKGRSLDVFISRLRKYLKDDPELEIRNHHGVGFSLICG